MDAKKKSRRQSETPQKLGRILQTALKQRNISLDMKDQPVWDAWSKSVGPSISAQTRVDRFDHGTLFVKVSSPAWTQQLQFMKKEILEKVNGVLGKDAVKNLFFSVGRISNGRAKKKEDFALRPDLYPLKEREKRLIEKCASFIDDKDLSDILRRAMTKNIIRKKMADDSGST